MKIYKNFLNKKDFNNIKDFLMNRRLPWYFENVVNRGEGQKYGQLSYTFVLEGGILNVPQIDFDILKPLLKKIKYKKITRIKANLGLKDSRIVEHAFHTDQPEGTTGILYINENNGYTKFETGKKIKSVENTYVEFDSTLKHTGTTCTDSARRIVLNINYQ